MSSENLKKCPDEENLYSLVFNELPFSEKRELEEHFYYCDMCTKKVRAIYEAEAIVVSVYPNPRMGEAFKEQAGDVAVMAAAASENSKEIAVAKSMGGKYIIRLIPFLDRDKSVLEVQVKEAGIKGTLIIEGRNDRFFEAEIKDGFAVQEVEPQIDLSFMLIKVQK